MKTCKADGCNYNVFSNLYCQRHQYLRTDEKYLKAKEKAKNKPKKQYELKRTKLTYKKQSIGESQVFKEIAVERSPVSFISGLRVKLVPANFAHVLPKAQNKYPLFKLHKMNIVLLTEVEHDLFDAGTEEQRQRYRERMGQGGVSVNWEKLYQLREQLKTEYNGLKQ